MKLFHPPTTTEASMALSTGPGTWDGSDTVRSWHQGAFGERTEGGSSGPKWLPSEAASASTGVDLLEGEKSWVVNYRPLEERTQRHKWCRTVCPKCHLELPLTRKCVECAA